MTVVTDEQRKNPALAGWVASKDKENAAAKPVTPEQTAYNATANQFTAQNWGPTGTANGKTESQNLAAVIQQPGNTTKTTATPYINSSGQTDYHISGQPSTTPQTVSGGPTGLSGISDTNVGTTTSSGSTNQGLPTYIPPTSSGLNFDQATNQVRGQIDPMFARALDALQAQKYQDQLNGDELGMARGGAHSGLAADLQNKVAIGAAGKAADLDATRQTQIAQMAQDLVNRGQDNDFRNQQQKLAEYLGINQLNLQQQGQQADYTGQYNGNQTMQSQNQNFQQGIQQGDLTGWYQGLQTLAGQNQGFNQNMQNKTYDQNQQVINYNQSPNNPQNQGQVLQNQGQGIQNKLSQLQLNDYPAQSRAAAEQTQLNLTSGKISNEVAQYQFDELKNPNSAVNVGQRLANQIQQINLDNLPREKQLEIQRIQKEIAQIGVVHTTPQSEADKAADQVKLATANKQLEDIKKGIYPGDKPATTPTPKTTDYKLDPKFAEDIAYIKNNPNAATMLDTNSEEFIKAYGYDGYQAMRQAAGLD